MSRRSYARRSGSSFGATGLPSQNISSAKTSPGRCNSIVFDTLDTRHAAEAAAWLQAELLHAGEAEAIALARQIEADWLLTDDAAARLFASELGLEVHGSLGVILWAAAMRLLDRPAAEQALTQLAASSLWLSTRIQREAWAALEEIYGA